MSEKTLRVVVWVVVALVAVYAVGSVAGRLVGGGEAGGELAAALARVSAESVQEVRIAGPTDTVVLVRDGAAWKVNGFVADSSSVNRLWAAVSGSRVAEVVAENPANHGRLGVAADSAWAVEFRRVGGEAARLLLGKSGPIYPSAYARLPHEDRVYLLTGDLRNVVTRPVSDWRDRTIVKVDTSRVHEVVIERDGERFAVRRVAEGWTVGGQAADSLAVRDLLAELADLQAYGFPPEAASLGDSLRHVVALGAEGDTLADLTLGTNGLNFRVRRAGNRTVYDLSSWRADRLTPKREVLTRK